MGFKLVRVDDEPYKVILNIGSHTIGRGKFLDCNDNRVSRNHAELIVTSDSILLKSLHKNPCFIKEKSSEEIKFITQPDSQVLYNGDKFGLIRDRFWYEIILCSAESPESIDNNEVSNENTNQGAKGDFSETQCYKPEDEHCSESLLDEVINTPFTLPEESQANETDNHAEKPNTTIEQINEPENQSHESINQHDTTNPSISGNNPDDATDNPDLTRNNLDGSTSNLNDSTNNPDQSSNSDTPSKRPHSEETSPSDIKRVKTEPESPNKNDDEKTQSEAGEGLNQPVKVEAGSSQAVKNEPDSPQVVKNEPESPQVVKNEPDSAQGVNNSPANPQDCNNVPEIPQGVNNVPEIPQGANNLPGNPQVVNIGPDQAGPSNQQGHAVPSPARPKRERCMYGATCYRKNPQHKLQFSHPGDADWGSGARGVCPWGKACTRTDPRHWRDHDHPLGFDIRQRVPAPGRRRRQRSQRSSDSDGGNVNLIIAGKRVRMQVGRQDWTDSEDEDPYHTDDSDDWTPPSDHSQNHDHSRDSGVETQDY